MKTKKIYLSDKQALAFYREKATAEFWDQHWGVLNLQSILQNSKDDGLVIPAVKRLLPKESIILEGGCGMGQIVHALQYQGYKAIGIDYAPQTIQRIKEAAPELDVREGDMRALDLPTASLDGYISLGVIEHFWDGYQPIAREMQRTLRNGGFLFISFPYLSLLRKVKVWLHRYPFSKSNLLNNQQDHFYQFAFSDRKVISDLEMLGFKLKEKLTYDGIKGFKDEVSHFKPWLQEVYDGNRGRSLRPYLDKLFKPFAAHMVLLVMQKVV